VCACVCVRVLCVLVPCVRVRGVLVCVRVRGVLCVRVCAFFSFEFQQTNNDFDQHTSPRLRVISTNK
jgi:hypothetical protein